MIRGPISQAKAILLASLSVALLLLGYTWVSHRQHQINPKDTTIPSWGQLADGVKKFTRPDRKEERWICDPCGRHSSNLTRLHLTLIGRLLRTSNSDQKNYFSNV